jgi:predicted metal-binding membrane protein
VILVVIVIAAAWLALWAGRQAPAAAATAIRHGAGHATTGGPGLGPGELAGFAAGWTLMIAAMMLPGALPFVAGFDALAARRRAWQRWSRRLWPVALLLAGYAGVWLLFGLAARLTAAALAPLAQRLLGAPLEPAALLPPALVLAGAYQFTALKHHALSEPCGPEELIGAHWHWRGAAGAARAVLALGARYGADCLACCWALMLVMLAAGAHSLAVMLVLGAIMAAERNSLWAARLSRPLGAALIGLGLALVGWTFVMAAPQHGHG